MRVLPEIKNTPEDGTPSKYFSTKKARKPLQTKTLYLISLAAIAVLSLTFAIILSLFGLKPAIFMVVVLIALPLVVIIVGYPKVGILTILIAAYFIMWIIRMGVVDGPLGTVMDGTQALLIIGFFLKQKFNPDWTIFKTPIGIMILIWVTYIVLEVVNPAAASTMAWLYTMRTVGAVTLMYFVFSYHIKTLSFFRLLLSTWMVLSFLGALNAFKQEHFGFFAFEEANFNDPLVQSLLYINGTWRKFSIFNDPVCFSYNMAISAIFCFCRVISPISRNKKLLYSFLGLFCITTMLYSATRAAYVLVPAAFILYICMNMSKKMLVLGAIAGVFFLMLINFPTSNVTLYRFQSAFKPSDDASFNVRAQHQKNLKPFIHSHPFGGGLGGMGAWGVKFAPYSYLAQFPPDSGYFRVAGELGWVGLILFCSLFFVSLRQGILNYFVIKDPELKSYCLAMTLIVFALNVGSYPQEALVQYPTNVFFYLFLALIDITLKLDKEKQLKNGAFVIS